MRLSTPICLLAAAASTIHATILPTTGDSAIVQYLSKENSLLKAREPSAIDARATTPEQVYALIETVQVRLVEDLHAIERAVNETGLPWDGDLAEMNRYLMAQIRQTYDLVGTLDEISRVTKKVADRPATV